MRLPLERTCRLIFVVLSLIIMSVCHAAYAAVPAQPVVLVDQFHSNMLSLDTEDMWRMTMLKDELTSAGYTVEEYWGFVTTEALANCAIFVVPTPNRVYYSSERTALKDYVRQGGGVLFTASYGTWGGQSTSWAPICQSIANELGFNLDNNLPTDSIHNLHGYPYWITFNQQCMGTHSINNGINKLQSFSTTTLSEAGQSGLSSAAMVTQTDGDANPSSRAAVMAGVLESGRVVVTGSPLYFADPVPDRDIDGQLVTMGGLTAADNRRFAYNAITWLAGPNGHSLVDVVFPATGKMVYGSVDIRGTVCDASLTSYVVEYAPAPVSESTVWAQAGAIHNASVVMNSLGNWDTAGLERGDYVLRVTGTNSLGKSFSKSVTVTVETVNELSKISDLKTIPEGTLVKLSGKEVVAGTDDLKDRIYLEEQDRYSGVAVITSTQVARGSLATMVGTVGISDGAPVITAVDITSEAGPAECIRPLGLSNALAGRSVSGLATTGMLVKVWGKVLSSDSEGFTIDDGSLAGGLKVLTNLSNAAIDAPETGSTAAVTGIGTSYNMLPSVIMRDAQDIKLLD